MGYGGEGGDGFFREGWVEEPEKTISCASSEEVLEHMDLEGAVVEEEGYFANPC